MPCTLSVHSQRTGFALFQHGTRIRCHCVVLTCPENYSEQVITLSEGEYAIKVTYSVDYGGQNPTLLEEAHALKDFMTQLQKVAQQKADDYHQDIAR